MFSSRWRGPIPSANLLNALTLKLRVTTNTNQPNWFNTPKKNQTITVYVVACCTKTADAVHLSLAANTPDAPRLKDPGGEYVAFTRGEVTAEGPVESWLVKVEQAMRDALYDNAKRAVNEYPRGRDASIRRDKWLWDYPAQVRTCLLCWKPSRSPRGCGCPQRPFCAEEG